MINESDLVAWEYYSEPESIHSYLVLGQENCMFCHKALKLLDDLGYPYMYRDIHEIGAGKREDYEQMAGVKFKTVPQIFANMDGGGTEYVGGYNELLASLL